jgi:GNAT superfamily N-acetyltransferase
MRPGNLLVRRANEGDLTYLEEILRACKDQLRENGVDQWDDSYPDMTTFAADVLGQNLYVAAVPGYPIAGAVVVDSCQEPEYAQVPWRGVGASIGVIHRLMVRPCCQRRGVARSLIRFAEAWTRRLGYGDIRMSAGTGNLPALRLYAALGYHNAGAMRFRKGLVSSFEKDLALPALRIRKRSTHNSAVRQNAAGR